MPLRRRVYVLAFFEDFRAIAATRGRFIARIVPRTLKDSTYPSRLLLAYRCLHLAHGLGRVARLAQRLKVGDIKLPAAVMHRDNVIDFPRPLTLAYCAYGRRRKDHLPKPSPCD